MFEIYLFCLIVGGGLLGFSIFAGGGDADVGADADIHADIHSLDTDAGTEISHVDLQHEDLPVHADAASGVKFLSIRNGVYFCTFFGLTGTVLQLLDFGFVSTFIPAVGVGGFSAYFGYRLMKYLKGSETGEAVNLNDVSGFTAKVSLPIVRGRRGKIYFEIKGQTAEIAAEIADASEKQKFNLHDEVLVVEIKDGVAKVVEVEL